MDGIKDLLKKAIHPEINNNLVDLGMIKDIKINRKNVLIQLALPFLDVPIRQELISIIKQALHNYNVKINCVSMSDKEKEIFFKKAREGWKI